MRILYITQTFPPEPGSTQRPLKQAVHLQRLGHRVTILTTMPYYPMGRVFPGYRGRLWMRENMEGVDVIRIWSLPASNRGVIRRSISQFSFALVAAVVGTFLRRHDLVIASVPNMATELAGLFAGRLRGSKVLVEMRDLVPDNLVVFGISPRSLVALLLAAYYRRIYRWADGVIVLQQNMAVQLAQYGVAPERVLLLPHAADPEQLNVDGAAALRRKLGLEDKFVVLYAGSFTPQYAIPNLVAVAARIATVLPRVHLLLFGAGPDRQRVKNMTRHISNVTVLDPVPPRDVGAYLQAADLFLAPDTGVSFPSYYDGCLGTKTCEYLMVGRPIIAVENTNVLGEFLKATGAGVAVGSECPDRLVQQIAFFADNPQEARRCGERARAFAHTHLRRSAVVEEFERQLMRSFPPLDVPRRPPVRTHTKEPADIRVTGAHAGALRRARKRFLMRINGLVRMHLLCRRRFIRWLFGVRVVASPDVQSYCEWGSILQRLILRKYVRSDDSILDLGTGAHALIAIFASKRFPGVRVVATDILPERVSLAQKTAAANRSKIHCMATDMFQGIADKFDLVLFYPPAIPSDELAELGFSLETHLGLGSRRCWSGDGGSDGLCEIRQFLETVGTHLTDRGRAILCINPAHCDRAKVKELCQASGLVIQRIHTLLGITNAYVIVCGSSRAKRCSLKRSSGS